MLTIEKLNAGYGTLQILYDLSVLAAKKEITAIIGPNGSGKSTLLKCITGLADVFNGDIRYDGVKLVGHAVHEVARQGVVYLPQTRNIFGQLTLRENLLMAGYMHRGDAGSKTEESLSLFPTLKEYLHRKALTLSGGERQMLSMAMGLMREPKVMLIDEPTANLAPIAVAEVLNRIIELRDKLGITIILVEQNAQKALEIADKAYLLVAGRLAFNGQPKELLAHRELSKLYLGALESST